MYAHHQASLDRITEHFAADDTVLALLLTGSIAHGFADERSDVDLAIIVSDEEHQRRIEQSQTTFFSMDLVTYEGGYADGKYISTHFMEQVAERGSEPARFAFADAQIVFSKIDGLDALLKRTVQFPAGKIDRIRSFYAQFEAWHWFTTEARKRNNPYLMTTAVSKLVLFGGRMILAHNEQLYPYHKWFLRVLEKVQDRPADLMPLIDAALNDPTETNVKTFFDTVNEFREWEKPPMGWPSQFMWDSEINWMRGDSPIEDV
ncbi:MAG: nucleotidyltransferase domain-containing protein [Anaerolineae bacterium]|nr:nucleotidyltransferase domain-containing protein [Anaerolineae bacterium]